MSKECVISFDALALIYTEESFKINGRRKIGQREKKINACEGKEGSLSTYIISNNLVEGKSICSQIVLLKSNKEFFGR